MLRVGQDFTVFWSAYLEEKERDILYILGMGFDPSGKSGQVDPCSPNPQMALITVLMLPKISQLENVK